MKVFIAGPRLIKKLDKKVLDKLNSIYHKNLTVVLGDASGIDKAAQNYFFNLSYKNVIIYASQGKARNNVGNWQIFNVEVPKAKKGFDFYAAKDFKMAEDADYGFMIWNGKSKGTLNNIINLVNQNKTTIVYFIPEKEFYVVKNISTLKNLLNKCETETKKIYYELNNKNIDQISIYSQSNNN